MGVRTLDGRKNLTSIEENMRKLQTVSERADPSIDRNHNICELSSEETKAVSGGYCPPGTMQNTVCVAHHGHAME